MHKPLFGNRSRPARDVTRQLLWVLDKPGAAAVSVVLFRRYHGVGLLVYRATTPHQRVAFRTPAAALAAADTLRRELDSRGFRPRPARFLSALDAGELGRLMGTHARRQTSSEALQREVVSGGRIADDHPQRRPGTSGDP